MKKIGLIGNPLGHSLSPLIHQYWGEKLDLKLEYNLYELEAETLKSEIKKLVLDGLIGFNVTIPYKEVVYKMCNVLNQSAKVTGAVNAVRVSGGRLIGTNTDVYGFYQNLKINYPKMIKTKAVVLGAGGGARAAIVGLEKIGFINIVVASRNLAKTQKLANDLKVKAIDINNFAKSLESCDIFVNTTPLGMKGFGDLEIDFSRVSKNTIVYDIIYNPKKTKLLIDAKANKLRTLNGLYMLLYQAEESFNFWFSQNAEVDKKLYKLINKEL